jgi:hypothetical protein
MPQRRTRAGGADEALVERFQVPAQPLGRIAPGIEGDEQHLRRADRVGARDAAVHRRQRR